MKCYRCEQVDVPNSISSSYPISKEVLRWLGYCHKCVCIVKFNEAKFVSRPYKIPIDRKYYDGMKVEGEV